MERKPKILTRLLDWWNTATPEEQQKLADGVETSKTYLRSHAVMGRRPMTADYAAKVELHVARINRRRKPGAEPLPTVTRRDLCEVCRKCPHVKEAA